MPKKSGVPPEVVAVVRAWARAADLEDGARALAEGKRALAPEHAAILLAEVAEISIETLIEVLAREDAAVDDGTRVDESHGLPLYPRQIARLAAWQEDQRGIAKALGLDPERWAQQIEAGVERVASAASSPTSSPGTPARSGPTAEALRRVIGAERNAASAPTAAARREGIPDLWKVRFGKKDK
jgi:hypothetical protein